MEWFTDGKVGSAAGAIVLGSDGRSIIVLPHSPVIEEITAEADASFISPLVNPDRDCNLSISSALFRFALSFSANLDASKHRWSESVFVQRLELDVWTTVVWESGKSAPGLGATRR